MSVELKQLEEKLQKTIEEKDNQISSKETQIQELEGAKKKQEEEIEEKMRKAIEGEGQ